MPIKCSKKRMDELQLKVNSLCVSDMKNKWNTLNNILFHFYEQENVKPDTQKIVAECAAELGKFIRIRYPQLALKPYGSLVVGFGNTDSDIDYSLVLEKPIPNKVLKESEVLKDVAELVEGTQATWDIEFIQATVPLAKFHWKGLAVDISYANAPAIKGTEVLLQYCKWEPVRLRILGFWVKKWAKAFDICSKRNGTLSSYMYSLMLIYYLQRRSPRVLPYLHTEFLDVENENISLKGYYHKNVEPNWCKNTETVAELFVGFFEFYAKFAFRSKIIQIRSKDKRSFVRRKKEFGAPIVIRDCVQRRKNIAPHMKHNTMQMIIGIIKLTLRDLHNWQEEQPVKDERMRKLFNIE